MKTYFAITRRNNSPLNMLMGITCKAESREEAAVKITEEWIVEFGEAAFVDFICEVPTEPFPLCVFSMYLDTLEIHAQNVGNGISVSEQVWRHANSSYSLTPANEFEVNNK